MRIQDLIPKSLVDYIRIMRNKRRFPGRGISTPNIGKGVSLGEGVSLSKSVYIGENVSIGQQTYIHNGTMIVSGKIGKYCSIAFNCQIGMWEHPTNYISTSPKTYSYGNVFGFDNIWEHPEAPTIGNDVWIGSNVTIMRDITIGNGAIIGSGAVVTNDIPPYAIAVGVPAKVIKYRFNEEIIAMLLEIQWWNLSENELNKYKIYFKLGEKGAEELMRNHQELTKIRTKLCGN